MVALFRLAAGPGGISGVYLLAFGQTRQPWSFSNLEESMCDVRGFSKELLVCLIALLVAFPSAATAEKVYKWTDVDGNVHYTSTPPSPEAKPAELPPIMRGEVKLAKPNLVSCADHGGIDCQAGPDQDGSVICFDAFTGATARYRFSCNSPKLSITTVSDPDPNGQITIFVRNSKSVEAAKPAVFFKGDESQEIKLDGPEKIDAFGVAEFLISNDKIGELEKPTIAQLRVTCANCP